MFCTLLLLLSFGRLILQVCASFLFVNGTPSAFTFISSVTNVALQTVYMIVVSYSAFRAANVVSSTLFLYLTFSMHSHNLYSPMSSWYLHLDIAFRWLMR